MPIYQEARLALNTAMAVLTLALSNSPTATLGGLCAADMHMARSAYAELCEAVRTLVSLWRCGELDNDELDAVLSFAVNSEAVACCDLFFAETATFGQPNIEALEAAQWN